MSNPWTRYLPASVLCALLAAGCAAARPHGPGSGPASDEDKRRAMQYFIQAKANEAKGAYLGAIVALRNAADLDPGSGTIYQQLAEDYLHVEDERMAMQFARRGLQVEPRRGQLRQLLAQVLERRGDRRGAARQMEILLQQEPTTWGLYRHLAYLYMESGQGKLITPLFERVLRRPDMPPEMRSDIARVYSRIGRPQRAEDLYRQVIAASPETEDAWLGLAELLQSLGRREEALETYRAAAHRLPDSAAVAYFMARASMTDQELDALLATEDTAFLYRLGVALSEAEQYDRAARIFERLVDLHPDTAEGWLDLARFYAHADNYAKLDEVMERAVTAMPDSTTLYLFWGTALEQNGSFAPAVEVYQRGLERLPDEPRLLVYWGLALEQQDKWDEARALYEKALQQHPGNADLHLRQGVVLRHQRQWDAAAQHLSRALELDPQNSDALLHWGLVLEGQERWKEAVERLRQAAQLAGDTPHILFYLASGLEQASRHTGEQALFDEAVATFRHVLEQNPDDSYALNYLGYMFAEKGMNLQEAVQLLVRAVTLEPDNGAFLDSLGWAYYRLGDLGQAKDYLDRALGAVSHDTFDAEEQAVILDHAGDIAQALGRAVEARQHWQKALELTPANEELKRKLVD